MEFRDILNIIKLPFRKEKELYYSMKEILGFYPDNIEYYKQALIHKSMGRRNKGGKPVNNERLEFLGDAILDAAVGDIVFRHFPGKGEGFLTKTRSKLVQRETLNKLAQEMGVDELIVSASYGNVPHHSSIGGNAFEALVGAVYLDFGYDRCMQFLKKRIFKQLINIDKMAYKESNFKSKLIEWTQKNKVCMEFLQTGEQKDGNGELRFAFIVNVEDITVGRGTGFSKKEAQQKAAKEALSRLRREPQLLDAVFEAKRVRVMEGQQAQEDELDQLD